MIFPFLAFVFGLGFSLYFWGVIRTALWMLPCLMAPDFFVLTSVSWVSFWSLAALAAPWSGGAFDFRSFSKERWALIFFLTGLVAGTLLYSNHWFIFVICSLLPSFFLRLFSLLKHPPQQILFLPKWLKVALPVSLVILFVVRILET